MNTFHKCLAILGLVCDLDLVHQQRVSTSCSERNQFGVAGTNSIHCLLKANGQKHGKVSDDVIVSDKNFTHVPTELCFENLAEAFVKFFLIGSKQGTEC